MGRKPFVKFIVPCSNEIDNDNDKNNDKDNIST